MAGEVTIDDISEVSSDVQAIKLEASDTNRGVKSLGDQVAIVREQLDSIQKQQPQKKAAQKPKFNTGRGLNTLTGVSLNELALKINKANPGMSFKDAQSNAKRIQQSASTLQGGSKNSILRKVLGNRLGGAVQRGLISATGAEQRAASTLLSYNQQNAKAKAEPVEPDTRDVAIEALRKQVDQLSKNVGQPGAQRVAAPSEKAELRVIKEDLSETVAALKVLGFDMTEIKERLGTVPRGLSTEDRIKHALKSPNERIAARDAAAEVERAKREQAAAATAAPVTEPTPIAPTTPTPVAAPTSSPAVNAVRGPVPGDQLNQQTAEDKKTVEKKEDKEVKEKRDKVVNSKLDQIQRDIQSLHSDSFIGLIVMAIAAAIRALWDPIKKTIETMWNFIKTLGSDIKEYLIDPINEHVIQPIEKIYNYLAPQIDKAAETLAQKRDKFYRGTAETVREGIDVVKGTLKGGDYGELQQDRAASKHREELISGALKSGLTTSGNITSTGDTASSAMYSPIIADLVKRGVATSEEEARARGLKTWASVDGKGQAQFHKVTPLPVPQTPTSTSDVGSAMGQQSSENAQLKGSPTALNMPIIVAPQPTTIIQQGGGGSSGSDAILALLDGRNSEQSQGSYLASIFDHPATYGAPSRV